MKRHEAMRDDDAGASGLRNSATRLACADILSANTTAREIVQSAHVRPRASDAVDVKLLSANTQRLIAKTEIAKIDCAYDVCASQSCVASGDVNVQGGGWDIWQDTQTNRRDQSKQEIPLRNQHQVDDSEKTEKHAHEPGVV